MLDRFIAEATQCDFKASLEVRKPKSWLKSVCAFANGEGGRLLFGVDDNGRPVGLDDIKEASDKAGELVAARISPVPEMRTEPFDEEGKHILSLYVLPGRATPYYYHADGVRETFVRIGNESVPAPDHVVNELILKGTNRSFDAVVTGTKRSCCSFTLLEATYRERARLPFEPSDYVSFGLADMDGRLTNAGLLMADQRMLPDSRLFCTRWNGLEKGSVFDDALDDKEYEGSLVHLLQSGRDFVRNNSHVRFAKGPDYRIDKPDYAGRAVTEALVNALIHRDYLMTGAEVHIDMFDDRLEIVSPGGMLSGVPVQECDVLHMVSYRRNPVIADLFHRMRFMERRGSGLHRIIAETANLPGDASSTISSTNDTKHTEENDKEKTIAITMLQCSLSNEKENGKELDKEKSMLQDFDRSVLACFADAPRTTVRLVAASLGVADGKVRRALDRLKRAGLVLREGPTKAGRWIVTQKEA